MSKYDFVIVGAGFSGVMLARRLLADPRLTVSPAQGPRILLVDRHLTGRGRTTFAYWSQRPTVLDRWELASWRWLRVIGHDERIRTLGLDGWRYRAVSWDHARADLLGQLAEDPRVTLLEAFVDEVRDGPDVARVRVGDDWVSGRFVFDSRPRRTGQVRVGPASRRALTLYQSFRGIWVRTEEVDVDVSAATLLDFSADDGPDLGFAYVLPVDPRSAMVMAVRMGPGTELPDPAPAVPRELGQDGWEVVGQECGVTALVTPAPARRDGARVLAIGGRGGRVRASTGYAVTRILADTERIAAFLRDRGHPFAIPADPRRDRLLDAIWLHALATNRAALEPAFLALFAGVPIGAVLRFLDGRSNPSDLLRVVRALPPGPFLQAATHLALGTGPRTR
jgi:lycopene beta-cyclase